MRTSIALFFLCCALLAPNLLAEEGLPSRTWLDSTLQPLVQIGQWFSQMLSNLAKLGYGNPPEGAGPMIIPNG